MANADFTDDLRLAHVLADDADSLTEARFRAWSDALGTDLQGFTIGRGYLAQVFYDRDAIVGHWGRYADVVEVVPDAFAFHQTAIVLRRRDDRRAG